MRDKLLRFRAVALLALFLGFYGWQVWLAAIYPDHPGAKQRAAKHATEETKPRTPDELLADYTFWIATFTGLLFCVTAFQGFFLIRADKTARISAEIARDSLRISQRAYVSLDAVDVDQTALGDKFTVNINIVNASPTPATISTCKWRVVLSAPQPTDYVPLNESRYWSVVPRNGDLSYMIDADLPATREEINLFYGGRALLWFVVIVAYIDVFGDEHETAIAMNTAYPGRKFLHTDDRRYIYAT